MTVAAGRRTLPLQPPEAEHRRQDQQGRQQVERLLRAHDPDLIALPAFAVTLWMVLRGMPIRARLAGLLGATGAVIVADAVFAVLFNNVGISLL